MTIPNLDQHGYVIGPKSAAPSTAQALVHNRVGVVAFPTSGDAELGGYDEESKIIFTAGRLPVSFEEP